MVSKIEKFSTNVSCYYYQNTRANKGNEEESLSTVDWLLGVKMFLVIFRLKITIITPRKNHMTNLQG